MILIKKKGEPLSLTQYKKQTGASFDGCDKQDIREALLRDQGYICAYCMRRIENDRKTMKIEHWKAQSKLKTEAEKLNFKIMLGVCDGCRGAANRFTTCDEHRHDSDLTVNPFDAAIMDTIRYNREGHILSSDPVIDDDLNRVLNLNCEQAPSRIVQNRKAVYHKCLEYLQNLQKTGRWTESMLQRAIHKYDKNEEGRNPEFAGVPRYLLKRYLDKCSR